MCFFIGVILMKIIDAIVHKLDPSGSECCADADADAAKPEGSSGEAAPGEVAPSDVQVGVRPREDPNAPAPDDFKKDAENNKKLKRMGINTALAIAIHNFPEGLATFVGTLDDPAVGASLAIAIAIHNVPEGLCVAVPVYYSTGNRWKAFGWGILSGVSEPIGALLGWAILMNAMTEDAYGALFGIVGGMMIAIVMHELLPTAHRYDTQDKWVTNCVVLGMMIMASSLVMFLY
jgi:ZIP family zinc transporter